MLVGHVNLTDQGCSADVALKLCEAAGRQAAVLAASFARETTFHR